LQTSGERSGKRPRSPVLKESYQNDSKDECSASNKRKKLLEQSKELVSSESTQRVLRSSKKEPEDKMKKIQNEMKATKEKSKRKVEEKGSSRKKNKTKPVQEQKRNSKTNSNEDTKDLLKNECENLEDKAIPGTSKNCSPSTKTSELTNATQNDATVKELTVRELLELYENPTPVVPIVANGDSEDSEDDWEEVPEMPVEKHEMPKEGIQITVPSDDYEHCPLGIRGDSVNK